MARRRNCVCRRRNCVCKRRRNPLLQVVRPNRRKRTRAMKIRGQKRASQRYKAILARAGRRFRYVKTPRRDAAGRFLKKRR